MTRIALSIGVAFVLAGCASLLGIHDVQDDPGALGDGGGDGTFADGFVPEGGSSGGPIDANVRFVPSQHGRILFGRVPMPGEVSHVDRLPARMNAYRLGGAFGILLSAGGVRVYHNGSADLVDAALDGERADVVLLGLVGRQATPDYVGRITRALSPRLIVPTHHDAFFAPLDRGVHLLPGIDLDGFVSDVRRLAPDARVITPGYEEALAVPPASRDGRDAVLLD